MRTKKGKSRSVEDLPEFREEKKVKVVTLEALQGQLDLQKQELLDTIEDMRVVIEGE